MFSIFFEVTTTSGGEVWTLLDSFPAGLAEMCGVLTISLRFSANLTSESEIEEQKEVSQNKDYAMTVTNRARITHKEIL